MNALEDALSEHDYQDAEAKVTRLLKENNADHQIALLYLIRALCRFRQHDTEACIGDANASLRLAKTKAGYYLRALGYQASGIKDLAIQDLEAISTTEGVIDSTLWKYVETLPINNAGIELTLRRLKQSTQLESPVFYTTGFKVPRKRLYRINVSEIEADMQGEDVELRVKCCLVDEMSLYRDGDLKHDVLIEVAFNSAPVRTEASAQHIHYSNHVINGKAGFLTRVKYEPQAYLDLKANEILGIRIGPLERLLQKEAFDTFRIFDEIVCLEEWDASIPGKIWDSAIFLARLARNIVKDGSYCLDLSTGTGFVGIYASHGKEIKMKLSDLDVALNLMHKNVHLNKSKAQVIPLEWGNESQIQACLNFGQLDYIFASDVVYETAYLNALVMTLEKLSSDKTTLYLAYKQRGLSETERVGFWNALGKIYTNVNRLTQLELSLVEPMLSEAEEYGVEIWKATK